MKKCSRCGVEKPRTTEYFGRLRDGFQSWCKECKREDHLQNKAERNAKARARYYALNPREELPPGFKRCSICKEIKALDAFGKMRRNKDGRRGQCKECRSRVEYRENAEEIKAKRKRYYRLNRDKVLATTRRYKEENAEWYRSYNKAYYSENKVRIKESVKRYRRRRARVDVGFRLIARYRTRVYKALKGIEKPARTMELIGCTVDELKAHLEGQFRGGMSWDNYGAWHVDHIRPCASFDLTDETQVRECFHYTNLQPLWAQENLRKSAKIA